MATRKRFVRILITVALVLIVTAESGAFVYDSHYYLTFTMGLMTCFSWDEAQIIASGDEMTDRNKTTRAEKRLTKKKNKRDWHAFGHSEQRLNELWARVLDEENDQLRLMKFGQFLHFLQDWEAHAGYPMGIGHAMATITGKDPDSLAKDEARTRAMIQATLDHMAMLCGELGRLPEGEADSDLAMFDDSEEIDADQIVVDLVKASSPKWRSRKFGGLSKKGLKIIKKNRKRLELFIDEHLAQLPHTEVPEDFEPGEEERGIPSLIEMVFTPDGVLTGELAEYVAEAQRLEAEQLTPPDNEVRLLRAKQVADGWEILVKTKNNGYEPYPAGILRLIAADAATEEQIGETTMPIPRVQPGKTAEIEALIPTSRSAEQTLIGLIAEVGDFSGEVYEIWFMTDDDLAEVQRGYAERGRAEDGSILPEAVAAVEFAIAPKTKLTRSELCIVVHARTNLSDPTRSLLPVKIDLVRTDGTRSPLVGEMPRVWSISATRVGQRPIAKTFECLDIESHLCGMSDWTQAPPKLEFALQADDAVTQRQQELDDAAIERLRASCPSS